MSKDLKPLYGGVTNSYDSGSENCDSSSYTLAHGITAYDHVTGDVGYNEIPETGGNTWFVNVWWEDRPTNTCNYGDYIYENGWGAEVEVLSSEDPETSETIPYPIALNNPKPDNSDWTSDSITISTSASMGPFSASYSPYQIDIDDTVQTVKIDDSDVDYGKITWDYNSLNHDIGWSYSQEQANGARFDVNSQGLDADKNYNSGDDDVQIIYEPYISWAYDNGTTRIYESVDGIGIAGANVIEF